MAGSTMSELVGGRSAALGVRPVASPGVLAWELLDRTRIIEVALFLRGVVGAADLAGKTSAEGLLRLGGNSDAEPEAVRARFLVGGVRSILADRSFLKASRRDFDGSDRIA
jgi:hypothetical protein